MICSMCRIDKEIYWDDNCNECSERLIRVSADP